jgi:hypothetical protein
MEELRFGSMELGHMCAKYHCGPAAEVSEMGYGHGQDAILCLASWVMSVIPALGGD